MFKAAIDVGVDMDLLTLKPNHNILESFHDESKMKSIVVAAEENNGEDISNVNPSMNYALLKSRLPCVQTADVKNSSSQNITTATTKLSTKRRDAKKSHKCLDEKDDVNFEKENIETLAVEKTMQVNCDQENLPASSKNNMKRKCPGIRKEEGDDGPRKEKLRNDEEEHSARRGEQCSFAKVKNTSPCKKKISEDENNKVEDSETGCVVTYNRNDPFCIICEGTSGEMLSCDGTCSNQFHPSCLQLGTMPTKYVCDKCTLGIHTCFACGKTGDNTIQNVTKCSHANCGKYYHLECIQSNTSVKFEDKLKTTFTCPLHVCRYCTDKKSSKTSDKKILQCTRCPVAYHQYPCLPAGCAILTYTRMICDKHYEPGKNNDVPHINASWCFNCSFGGSLVCCDKCPASIHPECSEDLTGGVPSGTWECQDCRDENKLRYGDLVWVKYSIYRWWPAKICLPEEVPEKVLDLPHSAGEFPVQFFGSREYFWLNTGRAFRYTETNTGAKHGKSYLAKYFQKALDEAKEAYVVKKRIMEEKVQVHESKQTNKPPPYGHIKTNRPVSCIQTVLDRSEWPICQCKPDDPCKNACLNKLLYYECHPSLCPNGASCKNQRMLKGLYAKTKIFRSKDRGWGLKADENIKCGDFVIEYLGELIDAATCRERIKQYHKKNINDYYFLTIDKDNIIDAYPKGNLSRFMNHSCDPNCETQKWTVNGEVRVGLFASRDIIVGEEVSFNYHLDCLGNERKKCRCGAANCSGFLGVRPTSQHSISIAEKVKACATDEAKIKRKKKRKKIVHDSECFRCKDGGELLLCDRLNCTKAYHRECLMMDDAPRGRWNCPWHFCNECSKSASLLCSLCPSSFCGKHLHGQMTELRENINVCYAHSEEELENMKKEGFNRTNVVKSVSEVPAKSPPIETNVSVPPGIVNNAPVSSIQRLAEAEKEIDSVEPNLELKTIHACSDLVFYASNELEDQGKASNGEGKALNILEGEVMGRKRCEQPVGSKNSSAEKKSAKVTNSKKKKGRPSSIKTK